MNLLKIFLVLLFIATGHIFAQETVNVEKSDKTVQKSGQEFYIHEVKQGQTLYSIAKAYGVELDEILKHNPVAARNLEVGEKLDIPVKENRDEMTGDFDFFYHVSNNGETFREIADIYSIDPYLVEKANPELKVPLREGQYIKIPIVEKTREPQVNRKTAAAKDANWFDHVVKQGETLYGISRQYGVEMEDIIRMNPNLGESLEIGRVLRIPSKTRYPEVSEMQDVPDEDIIRHKVKSGENIYRIAIHYGISVDTIRQLNPELDEERLRIGQVVMVPVQKATENYLIHKVEERQTSLKEVARKYNMDIETLRAANSRIEEVVYRGQIIKIPLDNKRVPQNAIEESMMRDDQAYKQTDLDSVLCIGAGYGRQNKTYKVALFVPLYLESIDSLKNNEDPEAGTRAVQRAIRFIQFYEGFMIAVDTLRKQGMDMEIFVYDVNTDIEKTVEVLQRPEMRKMDLIVGPFFSQSFFYVSNFAEAYGINIINPFTSRGEVISGRKEVFKAQPSQALLPEQIKSYIEYYYPGAKIILVKDNPYQFRDEFAALKRIMSENSGQKIPVPNYLLYNALIEYSRSSIEDYEDEEDIMEAIPVENAIILKENLVKAPEDTTYIPDYVSEVIYMNDSLVGLKREISVVRKNVLITISEDKAFILDLLANLNVMRDSAEIHVIGLPDWNQFIDFEPELFMNMDVQIIAAQLMDYDSDLTKYFIDSYRSRYFAEPGIIAGQGFDLGYYFLSALDLFGEDFEDCLQYHKPDLTQNQFVFRNGNPQDGYENIYWYFYNFKDYKINREKNPFIVNEQQQKQSELSHARQFFD